jgi:hypothetical protein
MALSMALLSFARVQAQLEYFSAPSVLIPLETGKIFYVQSDANSAVDYYMASGVLFLNPGEIEESAMIETGYNNIRFTHDFNNDGFEDFISTDNVNLRLVINNNNATFPATEFTMPCANSKLVSEDFDDDGDFDFIVGNCSDAGCTIYTNNGMGSFTSTPGLDYMANSLYIDFDLDGIKDWLIFNPLLFETNMLKGLGSNLYESPVILPGLFISPEVLLYDYDDDGDLDALDPNDTFDTPVLVYINDNNDFSQSELMNYSVNTIYSQSRARLIDIDNDDDLDVLQLGVLSNAPSSSPRVLIFENQGDNIFSPPAELEPFHSNLSDLFVYDVNLDGWQDLALINGTGVQYNYINNNGVLENIEISHLVHNPATLDFLRDANNEITGLVLNYDEPASNEGGISIGHKKNDLSLGTPSIVHTPDQYFSPDGFQNYQLSSLITGSINNDNQIDLLDATYYFSNIQPEYFNDFIGSENGFVAADNLVFIHPYELHPLDLIDLNQDGFDDLIVDNWYQSAYVFWNNNGVFEETPTQISDQTTPSSYYGSFDFNLDGFLDVIYGTRIYYLNNAGEFTSHEAALGDNIKCVADMTGDLLPEIISVVNENTIIHFNNNGYVTPAIELFSIDIEKCTALDVNDDGNNDLVYSSGTNLELRINFGNANFSEPQIITSDITTTYLTHEDWDNDGDQDIFYCADYLLGQSGVYWIQTQAPPAYSISGTVFFDEDENGTYGNNDFPMAGVPVYNPETGMTVFSNSLGMYTFNMSAEGNYTIEANLPENMLSSTALNTTTSLDQNNNPLTSINFGFYPENPIVMIDAQIQGSVAVCNTQSSLWISIGNSGTVYTGVNTALILPPGVIYDGAAPAPSTVSGQILSWYVDAMSPFSYESITISIIYPGVEQMGNNLPFILSTYATVDNSVIADDTYAPELLCAFDPNDKTEFTGHTEMGYLSGEEPLEYVIRFQNTGNYVATDVRIEDQLSTNLDSSTFEIVGSSHPMEVSIDENNKVFFMFDEIMLPDSATDQTGSNGFVRFNIKPIAGLEHGTTIENTGEIYFDLNPPIITNTTLNTIYDCSTFEADLIWSSDVVCYEQGAQANINEEWIESIEWLVDGAFYSDASSIEITNITSEVALDVTIANALCGSSSETISINAIGIELPVITPSTLTFCEGEEVILTSNATDNNHWYLDGNLLSQEQNIVANSGGVYELIIEETDCQTSAPTVVLTMYEVPVIGPLSVNGNVIYTENLSGVAYQWMLNDQPIAGATQSSYTATESGNYSVQITTANDCSVSTSEVFVQVIGVSELNAAGFSVYPNPVSDVLTIRFADGGTQSISIFDAFGQVVYQNKNLTSEQKLIDVSGFASGTYTLEVQQNDKKMKTLVLVK